MEGVEPGRQERAAARAVPDEGDRDAALRQLVAQMPAAVWAVDRDLRLTFASGAGLTAFGLDHERARGRALAELLGTDDPELGPIVAHRMALEGRSTELEHNRGGRRFEIHVVPFRDGRGEIRGALGVAVDVTERMWEPGALFETETKYRGLIETIPAVTYIDPIDEWGDSLYVSPQITDLLGCTPERWLTDSQFWTRHVHPDDLERVWEEYRRARDAGAPYEQEYRMIHEDGHIVWVSERAVVLRDADGRPWVVQGVLIDITERKRVEDELERAWQRERETSDHLRELDRMKSLLLHAVSHDMRGPITAVLGTALMLEGEERLDADLRELVRGITASARKLARLVSDLLDLDRLERGILEPARRRTDLGQLAERLIGELVAEGHSIELELDGPVVATVDPVQVERILENLVLNAIRHTPQGTPIWIRLRRKDKGALLVVEDAGPGVPEELRQLIFEPFRQGTAADGRGLGIGLSLVAGFAELHGGAVCVQDREGGGASFRVYLPDEAAAASPAATGWGVRTAGA